VAEVRAGIVELERAVRGGLEIGKRVFWRRGR